MDAPFSFNGLRSIRIGSRRDRITGDSGALSGRELLRRSRVVVRFLAKGLPDKRDGRRIRHLRGGWRGRCCWRGRATGEHSDATKLRDDPALRLVTSDRTGTAPLAEAAKECVEVLCERLQRLAGWRLKAMGLWWRPKTLVVRS